MQEKNEIDHLLDNNHLSSASRTFFPSLQSLKWQQALLTFIYLKTRERDLSWFAPQRATTAVSWAARKPEAGMSAGECRDSAGECRGVQGPMPLGNPLLPSQTHSQGAESQVEQPGLEPALTPDASIAAET